MVDNICEQLRAGDSTVTGVMIESNINSGRQDVPSEGPQALKHGVSITDACVDWATTVTMLDNLNEVRCPDLRFSKRARAHLPLSRLSQRDVPSLSRRHSAHSRCFHTLLP